MDRLGVEDWPVRPCDTPRCRRRCSSARRGFSLVEIIVALALLAGVVLAMAMGMTASSHSVSDSGARSRANAMADQQITMARVWTNYPTLGQLESPAWNVPVDGLTPATTVVADSTGGVRTTVVTVTITGNATSGLGQPVVRRITLAAP
jgi:prepilin-type N-terminal cleavage/methylation domain-containing protein